MKGEAQKLKISVFSKELGGKDSPCGEGEVAVGANRWPQNEFDGQFLVRSRWDREG